jgi:hypothetical protein
MASRIRRREVKYLEKLATKYRVYETLFDSPYNASVLSIPDYVPTPMPNPGPAEFGSGLPNEGLSSIPGIPDLSEPKKFQPVSSEDEAIVIEENDSPKRSPDQPEPGKEKK